MIASKLGNILIKEERNFIRKELYKLENKKRFTKTQRERAYTSLIELVKTLNNKQKHQYSDYQDQDCFEIKDIENLFDTIDINEYYKPVITKETFNNKYQYYETRGNRHKRLSLKQYLYTITPELAELINEKTNNENEQKFQLTVGINVIHTTDGEKSRTFHVKSDNVVIRQGSDTNDIIAKLFESFFSKYEHEENILRNGNNFSFESVDMAGVHFHGIELKSGSS